MNQLTQKERMLLEDGKRHEELCIRKYGDYALRVQDPQLAQMFNQHRSHEAQHYQTLTNILGQGGRSQGGQPQGGQGGQSQGGQGGQGGQSGQTWQGGQASQVGQGVQNNAAHDVSLVQDLLMTEDFVSSAYDTAIFQVSDAQIRQSLEHIQKDEHQHGADLTNYLQQQGISG